jgi:hypothetical protein
MCGATLERTLQDALVQAGVLPEMNSNDERTPGAAKLRRLAKDHELIGSSSAAVDRVFEQRDRVVHRHIWDDKIIEGIALKCIEDLAAILRELPGRGEEPRS